MNDEKECAVVKAIEQGFCRLCLAIAVPGMIFAVAYWVDTMHYLFWE